MWDHTRHFDKLTVWSSLQCCANARAVFYLRRVRSRRTRYGGNGACTVVQARMENVLEASRRRRSNFSYRNFCRPSACASEAGWFSPATFRFMPCRHSQVRRQAARQSAGLRAGCLPHAPRSWTVCVPLPRRAERVGPPRHGARLGSVAAEVTGHLPMGIRSSRLLRTIRRSCPRHPSRPCAPPGDHSRH